MRKSQKKSEEVFLSENSLLCKLRLKSVTRYARTDSAITLIALVITIIVLLILAGVSLSLIMGNEGILGRAENAVNEYSKAQAREKLELVLGDLGADKFVNPAYNSELFINERLEEEGMEVSGDGEETIVTVDEWEFKIDRTVPKIVSEGEQVPESKPEGEPENPPSDTPKDEPEDVPNSGVSSEQYEALLSRLTTVENALQDSTDKISELESKNEELQTEMDSWQYDGYRFDTLYEGTASSTGTYNFTFPTGKSLNSYKQLVFFTDAYYIENNFNDWAGKNTVIAEPKVKDVIYDYAHTFVNAGDASKYFWNIFFSINSQTTFRIDSIGIGSVYNAARIYKVIGLY